MRATNEEVLAIAQWRKDGVALEYIYRNPMSSNRKWRDSNLQAPLDFDMYEYRRKPSEPVIMYACHYQATPGRIHRKGFFDNNLYETTKELYEENNVTSHVEVKVFPKGDAQ